MKKRLIKSMLAFLRDAGDVTVDAVAAGDVKVAAAASKSSFDVASVLAIFEADDRGAVKACLADLEDLEDASKVAPAIYEGHSAEVWAAQVDVVKSELARLGEDHDRLKSEHAALLAWAEAQTPADAEPEPAMTPAVEPERSNVVAMHAPAVTLAVEPEDEPEDEPEAFDAFCAARPHMSKAVLAYAYKYKAANAAAALEID